MGDVLIFQVRVVSDGRTAGDPDALNLILGVCSLLPFYNLDLIIIIKLRVEAHGISKSYISFITSM